jgi:hypothetical protein
VANNWNIEITEK